MATVSIKRIVANAVADYIAANIPALAGKVSAVAAGPETNTPCLAVKIIPSKMNFEASNYLEVYWNEAVDDGKVVLDVGQWVGQMTIELYTTSPAERELYEQAILDLFTASDWTAGVFFVALPNLTINNYVSLYSDEARVGLESSDWVDEMTFESKRYTFLTVDVDYPALTTRDAATITDLELWLQTAS